MGVKGVKGGGGQDASRARVLEFLQRHTAYELIPESAKVVVLDTKLPVRKAFHACYEQGITAAPLWDEHQQEFVGMLSTGDFIDIVRSLGPSLTAPAGTKNSQGDHRVRARGARGGERSPTRPARLRSPRGFVAPGVFNPITGAAGDGAGAELRAAGAEARRPARRPRARRRRARETQGGAPGRWALGPYAGCRSCCT